MELNPDQVQTIVLAVREIMAICGDSLATIDEIQRLPVLRDLVLESIKLTYRNRPGGGLAMISVFSADLAAIDRLVAAVCTSEYVNVEPFIVTTPGGPRLKPREGYALIQRNQSYVWRELFGGGVAIPNPGPQYHVT
ncbi:MAG TPA: hypothetical protein VEY93_01550, partial [Longimicrobium sp.]|nr:hypothetical protein [Longimicrobium sp.]